MKQFERILSTLHDYTSFHLIHTIYLRISTTQSKRDSMSLVITDIESHSFSWFLNRMRAID